MSSEETTNDPWELFLSAMASGRPQDEGVRRTLIENVQDEVESIAAGELDPGRLAHVLKVNFVLYWEMHHRLTEVERWAKRVQDGAKALRDRAGEELSPEVKAHAERVREANDVS